MCPVGVMRVVAVAIAVAATVGSVVVVVAPVVGASGLFRCRSCCCAGSRCRCVGRGRCVRALPRWRARPLPWSSARRPCPGAEGPLPSRSNQGKSRQAEAGVRGTGRNGAEYRPSKESCPDPQRVAPCACEDKTDPEAATRSYGRSPRRGSEETACRNPRRGQSDPRASGESGTKTHREESIRGRPPRIQQTHMRLELRRACQRRPEARSVAKHRPQEKRTPPPGTRGREACRSDTGPSERKPSRGRTRSPESDHQTPRQPEYERNTPERSTTQVQEDRRQTQRHCPVKRAGR
jgi:hypothetical protein